MVRGWASSLLVSGVLAACVVGCAHAPPIEAFNLTGEPLYRPVHPENHDQLMRNLRAARHAARANPHDEDAAIWYGRRLAYAGRYKDAIAVYTRALAHHPDSVRLLRHRGHRYITTRQFERAQRDLARAASLARGKEDHIEPDGMPNEAGIPRTTTHFNVYYHLALARYLMGDYAGALRAQQHAIDVAKANDDMLCASSYWLYLTLCRLGRMEEARAVLEPIRPDMNVIENHAYLRALLMFQGHVPQAEIIREAMSDSGAPAALLLYAVGAEHLCDGQTVQARAIFEAVIAQSPWPAFGHIAAAADLHAFSRAEMRSSAREQIFP